MKAKCVSVSVKNNLNEVTLFVQDLEQFKVGKQYEIVIRELEETADHPPAENVVPMTPDTTGTPPTDLTPQGTTAAPETVKPTPCTQCCGSGVVAVFQDGQRTGEQSICDTCKGTGIQPAAD